MTTDEKLTELSQEWELIDSLLITKLAKLVDEEAIVTTLKYYFPNHLWDESDYLAAPISHEAKIALMGYKVRQILDKKKINSK
jgi:uncharacterized membrane protein